MEYLHLVLDSVIGQVGDQPKSEESLVAYVDTRASATTMDTILDGLDPRSDIDPAQIIAPSAPFRSFGFPIRHQKSKRFYKYPMEVLSAVVLSYTSLWRTPPIPDKAVRGNVRVMCPQRRTPTSYVHPIIPS